MAFESRTANLTAHDTNGVTDVFVHDNDSKHTVRVSKPEEAKQALVYDLKTGVIQRVPAGPRSAG